MFLLIFKYLYFFKSLKSVVLFWILDKCRCLSVIERFKNYHNISFLSYLLYHFLIDFNLICVVFTSALILQIFIIVEIFVGTNYKPSFNKSATDIWKRKENRTKLVSVKILLLIRICFRVYLSVFLSHFSFWKYFVYMSIYIYMKMF